MLTSRGLHMRALNIKCFSLQLSGKSFQVDIEQISVPREIPGGATNVLNALSKTVARVSIAAHYKYHDDPFLIPHSNQQKRLFALAQESGRKAARWVRQEHRNLFQHAEVDPPIKVFDPKMLFNEKSEVNEEHLEKLIRDAEVADAVSVFNIMRAKGIRITDYLKQSLLEMLCFYNHSELIPLELIEERWFQQNMQGKERQRKTWKDGELAELLFGELPPSPRSYAAIIRGMCKYFQVERAFALFQEAQEKFIELEIETFNAILSITNFLKESAEPRWELCQDILSRIRTQRLRPNLGTLNALLSLISNIGNFRLARTFAIKVLGEFKSLGVELSLASWYYVLLTFYRERGPVSHILSDILKELEGKEFEIRDVKDTFFFTTAMDIARNHLHDKTMAKRIDALLLHGRNYDLIGDSYKESVYYRHLFALLCQTETLEEFMKIYDLLVPNIYTPEPGIMEEIVKAVDMNSALEYVPRLWSDIIIFDHISRDSLVNLVLKIIMQNPTNLGNPAQVDLQDKFNAIAWDVFTRIEDQSETRTQRIGCTGQMLGNILSILSKGKDFEKARTVFKKLDKNQHQIPGTASAASMTEYVKICIGEKRPNDAIDCLEYCVENGLDCGELARKIQEAFTLSESFQAKVRAFAGGELLTS